MKTVIMIGMLLLVTTAPADAQARFGGGVQGGLTFASFAPALKDFYGTGFGGGGHLALDLGRSFSLRLTGDFRTFKSDKTKFAEFLARQFTVDGLPANPGLTGFEGMNVNLLGITLSSVGRLLQGSAVTPYGIAGIGVHVLSATDPKVSYGQLGDITAQLGFTSPESETAFGLNGGLGVEFRLGAAKLFVEGQYVLLFTKGDKSSHFPVSVGVTF